MFKKHPIYALKSSLSRLKCSQEHTGEAKPTEDLYNESQANTWTNHAIDGLNNLTPYMIMLWVIRFRFVQMLLLSLLFIIITIIVVVIIIIIIIIII